MWLTKWDKRFLKLAREVATWSKDPSSQVGCVIAQGKRELAFGYNGFPECIEDKSEWYKDRDLKLSLVIHAEKNARNKVEKSSDLVGATIYIWPFAPCGECAKEIVSWGITRIVAPKGRKEMELATEHVVNHTKLEYVSYYWCDPRVIDE